MREERAEYAAGYAGPEDGPRLRNLANSVFRRDRTGDMAAEYPLLFAPENLQQIAVIRTGGEIVAMAGAVLRDLQLGPICWKAALWGSVATDPAHRGRGLASLLIEKQIERHQQKEVALILISGDRGLYLRRGFGRWGEFCTSDLPAEVEAAATDLREAGTADIPALQRLHEQEPVRFCRPAADWRMMLQSRMLENAPGRIYVAQRHGVPVAYVAVRRGRREAEDLFCCVELAGDRAAAASAARALAAEAGLPAVRLVLPAADPAWRLIEPAARSGFDGTVGFIGTRRQLVEAAELLEGDAALRCLKAAEQLGEQQAPPEPEQLRLVSRLLFGDPAERGSGSPLPLPRYGLNYI